MEVVGFIASVLVGLFLLVLLVVVHELGHAIVARRNGVVVEEFGVGFPPQAWSKKVPKSFLGKNVTYSVNWLPLGGFVKLQGEHDSASRKGDYGSASFWAKTKIMLAGVSMNWATAAVLFTILALIGMPKVLPNQWYVANDTAITTASLTLDSVSSGSPAAVAGLQKGDVIRSIDGRADLAEASSAAAYTKEHAGTVIKVEYVRGDSAAKTVTTMLNTADKASDGYLGVMFSQKPTILRSTWSAPLVGIGLTGQLSWETLKGLGHLVGTLGSGIAGQFSTDSASRAEASAEIGQAGKSVAGPFGIVFSLLPGAVSAGIVPVLLVSAILSLTLAVMNVLPIPALDGGRWYLMAAFRLLKKPLTEDLEEKINSIGMLILFGLVILVTIADVGKLF